MRRRTPLIAVGYSIRTSRVSLLISATVAFIQTPAT